MLDERQGLEHFILAPRRIRLTYIHALKPYNELRLEYLHCFDSTLYSMLEVFLMLAQYAFSQANSA
jgi:hypothetical protein